MKFQSADFTDGLGMVCESNTGNIDYSKWDRVEEEEKMLEEQKNLEVRFIYINFKMNIRYPTIDMKV